MASPETGCAQDIAEMLWEKYSKRFNAPRSADEIKKTISLLDLLVANFQWPLEAVIMLADINEQILKNNKRAAALFKIAADKGSPHGARCYADMVMARIADGTPADAKRYYLIASQGGIGEASFVLGEFEHRQGDRDKALQYYRLAVEQGCDPHFSHKSE